MPQTTFAPSRFLPVSEVVQRSALGRDTIRDLVAAGEFPAPVVLARKKLGWSLESWEAWATSRPTAARLAEDE